MNKELDRTENIAYWLSICVIIIISPGFFANKTSHRIRSKYNQKMSRKVVIMKRNPEKKINFESTLKKASFSFIFVKYNLENKSPLKQIDRNMI